MDLLTSTKPNDRTIKADRLVQIDYNLGQIKWNSKPLPPTPEPFSSIRILKWGGGGGSGGNFPSMCTRLQPQCKPRNADGEEDKSVRCDSPQQKKWLLDRIR